MANWKLEKFKKLAKGFRGKTRNCVRSMIPRVHKSLLYAYRDRKVKRREFRQEWIAKIHAGAMEHGIQYRYLINGLSNSNLDLNRKILADLAENEPFSFKAVVEEIKVQKNLEINVVQDMDFLDAVNRNYLVYRDVPQIEKQDKVTIPYYQVKPSLEEKTKDMINIRYHPRYKYLDKDEGLPL
jgi:large subunit ribosomal protein L20